jgi:hypothetical protein
MTSNAYIYLIQDGGYVNTNVYKVGRTTQNGDTRTLNRFKCYSTNTIQIYVREVNTDKVVEIEKNIIKVFTIKYNLEKGVEWFNGNKQQMIADIDIIINKFVGLEQLDTISKASTSSDTIDKSKDIDKPEDILENKINNDTFCERCGINFKNKKYLIQHLHKELECVCLYSDISRKDILTLLKLRTGIECERCKRIYKNKETVRKHNCKGYNISPKQKNIY